MLRLLESFREAGGTWPCDRLGNLRVSGKVPTPAPRKRGAMERTMAGNELAARMELCRECLVLRGPFFDSHNGCERVQRCGCEPREPLWNAFDYNCAAELCPCCASRVIGCGSKWSVFFCEECKPHVVAYNGAAGLTVIPIGRHSMMDGRVEHPARPEGQRA